VTAMRSHIQPMRKAAAALTRAVLHSTGVTPGRARRQKRMRILFAHEVGAASIPSDVFRAQMEFLKNDLRVVPLSEIVDGLRNGAPEADGAVALTFDDGLRSHYTVVRPILMELGLPATFYVCPGLIDRGERLWNNDLRARMQWMRRSSLQRLLASVHSPSDDISAVVEWLKTLSQERLQSIRSVIVGESEGFEPTESQRDAYDSMTWADVLDLPQDLITVGSHTMNHPILATLENADIEYELRESKRVLEEKLGRPVEHFCYPNGTVTETAVSIAREIYVSASTTRYAFVNEKDSPHLLPRILLPRSIPTLSWRLSHPGA